MRRSAVAQWESDEGTRPTVEHMALIAETTGVLFEWLATGRGQQYSDTGSRRDREILGIANTDLESRMLDAMKVLCESKQKKALKLVEVLVGD